MAALRFRRKTRGTAALISALCALSLAGLCLLAAWREEMFWTGYVAGVFTLSGLLSAVRSVRIYAGEE